MAIVATYLDDNDGTGGVLTITGSTAGTSNAVYVSEYTGGSVGRVFRLLGTRTGDGIINYVVAQSGPFLVSVVNTNAGTVTFSQPQVFRAGDGEESLHMQICIALREMILDMALPSLSSNPDSHLICKIGAKIQDVIDTDGKCVFYIPTQESLTYSDNSYDSMEFPVNVVVTRAAGHELVKGLADTLKARELTHQLFGAVPIPDLIGVHTVDYRPGVVNDATQWLAKYDVSVVTLVAMSEVAGGIF